MGDSETPFEKLLAQQRTDKDRQHLHNIRDLYGLKGSDAMWSVVMLFQNYLTAMERIPGKIDEAARSATEAARVTAEATAKAAQAKMEHAATKAIERAAIDSAKKVAGAQLCKWICGAAVVICLSLIGTFTWGYARGVKSGTYDGKEEVRARYERAAAASAWANSDEGQLAYGLAKVGSLRAFATCSGRGVVRKGNVCFAKSEKSAPFSWRLPDEGGAER